MTLSFELDTKELRIQCRSRHPTLETGITLVAHGRRCTHSVCSRVRKRYGLVYEQKCALMKKDDQGKDVKVKDIQENRDNFFARPRWSFQMKPDIFIHSIKSLAKCCNEQKSLHITLNHDQLQLSSNRKTQILQHRIEDDRWQFHDKQQIHIEFTV